jgi:hypothetical protein
MFSAKKLIDSQAHLGPVSDISENDLFNMINRLRDEMDRDELGDDDVDDNE